MRTAQERRGEAMKWWALLTNEERIYLAMENHQRKPSYLTGREIEKLHNLYRNKTNHSFLINNVT